MKGKSRNKAWTRARALRAIQRGKEDIQSLAGQDGHEQGLEDTRAIYDADVFTPARAHNNYHVRVAAWRAQGCPLPAETSFETDYEEHSKALTTLAKELHPNHVRAFFTKVDEEEREDVKRETDTQGPAVQSLRILHQTRRLVFVLKLLRRLGNTDLAPYTADLEDVIKRDQAALEAVASPPA